MLASQARMLGEFLVERHVLSRDDLAIAIDTPLGLKVTDLYEHSRHLFDRETHHPDGPKTRMEVRHTSLNGTALRGGDTPRRAAPGPLTSRRQRPQAVTATPTVWAPRSTRT